MWNHGIQATQAGIYSSVNVRLPPLMVRSTSHRQADLSSPENEASSSCWPKTTSNTKSFRPEPKCQSNAILQRSIHGETQLSPTTISAVHNWRAAYTQKFTITDFPQRITATAVWWRCEEYSTTESTTALPFPEFPGMGNKYSANFSLTIQLCYSYTLNKSKFLALRHYFCPPLLELKICIDFVIPSSKFCIYMKSWATNNSSMNQGNVLSNWVPHQLSHSQPHNPHFCVKRLRCMLTMLFQPSNPSPMERGKPLLPEGLPSCAKSNLDPRLLMDRSGCSLADVHTSPSSYAVTVTDTLRSRLFVYLPLQHYLFWWHVLLAQPWLTHEALHPVCWSCAGVDRRTGNFLGIGCTWIHYSYASS